VAGAKEIDIVISRRHVLTGNWQALYDEMRSLPRGLRRRRMSRRSSPPASLGTLRNVARASLVCMMAGADFIKTSTGKESVNATLPVSLVMIRAIRAYEAARAVGYKPAGGISKAKDALVYLMLMKEELGDRWLRPDLFRFGASSLLGDIERQLEHHVTGAYSASYRHPGRDRCFSPGMDRADVLALGYLNQEIHETGPTCPRNSMTSAGRGCAGAMTVIRKGPMTTREIFDTMDYGPAPESAPRRGLDRRHAGRLRAFHRRRLHRSPARPSPRRTPRRARCWPRSRKGTRGRCRRRRRRRAGAFPKWAKLPGHARARYLYALARLLQKHARLFAVLESLDNGKPIRESRDIDVPLAQRHFYYHAGLAQLLEQEMPGRPPLGVCGQVIPWNFPLLMLAWKIAPALAAGNTVVLKPAEYTSLTALLFAEICREAGLPKGVVNIVTGDGATGAGARRAPGVDKIAFTGSTEVGRRIREATAGQGKALTLELGGKSPYIVFDDADLDSAVEGWSMRSGSTRARSAARARGCWCRRASPRPFHAKLKARMDKLRVGDPLDKSIDVGAIVDPVQLERITRDGRANTEGETLPRRDPDARDGLLLPADADHRPRPAAPLMQEEIFGPVLVSTTFRTPAEAVQLANNTRYGLAATVWSENINLALDIAPKLRRAWSG
jgi:acyl-CoA reductase-like NAD-dependent aldehyde dehydrogenase/deoxyribose-phosphate aldolase